jgi:hypothetical protein
MFEGIMIGMTDPVKAEWIPAHLSYDGPAKIAEYFDSRITEGEDGSLIGFFRGHELTGKVLEIPEGYHACMVSMEGDRIEQVQELTQVRVWDLDVPSLEVTMEFTDVIEIGRILSED